MMQKSRVSPFTIVVTAICLSIIGVALLPLLPLKLSPSEKMQSISVSYTMRNATSKIVESEVTSRLEAMFARIKGVESISSTSGNGYGNVRMRFDKHTDIDVVRFEVSTIIRQAWPEMPEGVSFPSIYVDSSDDESQRPFLVYTINSVSSSLEIQQKAEDVFKTGFSDIGGVSAVDIYGAEPMQWRLTYDMDKLQHLGITEQNISDAIGRYRYSNAAGQYIIKTEANDTIFNPAGIYVTLPDSSLIGLDHLISIGYVEARANNHFRINGLNSIYLSLKAAGNANQISLQSACEQRISELKRCLPEGYEMHKAYDATEYISAELDKIYFRSGMTIVILLVFIAITTLSWRSVFVVICSLLSNLAIAVIAYYILGVELQLYSLAGITISLNLIIDNTIIMYDHWRREHNVGVILPIVAATLTTIGALSIVFFLEEELRLNLYDFAIVMIVNLMISIFTALWLVPALMRMLSEQEEETSSYRRRRWAIKVERGYTSVARFVCRFRKIFITLGVIGFGLPLFMMPKEIDAETTGAKIYNAVFGSETYQEKIRPIADVALGGALRLFVEKVYNGSYWSDTNETILTVYATLPYGSTIEQMDELIRRMESYLTGFSEIRQFQTQVDGGQRANISIYFTKEAERSSFPYILKSNIVSKALQLGGGSWSVYGLPDNGFSNDVRQSSGSYHITMHGYNYETLQAWADSIRQHLLSHKRIKEVDINSSFQYYKNDYVEYHLVPNTEYMVHQEISTIQLYNALRHVFVSDINCGVLWNGVNAESIVLCSKQSQEYDIWALLNTPVELNNRQYKISQLCSFVKTQAPQSIEKTDQQYNLCLQYEYIGSSMMGDKVSHATDSIYNARMPIGYKAEYERTRWSWGSSETQQYWLLVLVVAIIFFVTSILFNSLRLPFIIIGMVPMSYIGLFLTFYLFKLNFDQGGFAAFVLLCGITVNASIYIVNESQKIKRKRRMSMMGAYVRAFDIKIIPIMLTILSTILGFVPFMIGDSKEGFWFPLAAGTIGGLVFSLIGLVVYMPVFYLRGEKSR